MRIISEPTRNFFVDYEESSYLQAHASISFEYDFEGDNNPFWSNQYYWPTSWWARMPESNVRFPRDKKWATVYNGKIDETTDPVVIRYEGRFQHRERKRLRLRSKFFGHS